MWSSSVVNILLLLALLGVGGAYYYFKYVKGKSSAVTTTKPSTTSKPTWVKIPYTLNATSGGTSANSQGSDAANQQYTLANGYNCYVYDGLGTIYPRKQGNTGTGNTLLVYKNGTYYTVANTAVDFGPNTKTAFSNVTLGTVLNNIKQNSNNLALITGIVNPTARLSTLVGGTYSTDQAMLNVSADTTFYTWFYGGTTFPYAYSLSTFTPSSS